MPKAFVHARCWHEYQRRVTATKANIHTVSKSVSKYSFLTYYYTQLCNYYLRAVKVCESQFLKNGSENTYI